MVGGDLRYEPLGDHHLPLRRHFRCGEESLDVYLRSRQAWRDHEQDLAVVRVLYDPERNRIAGYYTLSSFYIRPAVLADEITQGRTKYEVYPATLIGRLARDGAYPGRGIGGRLLLDALKRSLDASAVVASYAVVVEAISENAASFYRGFGFELLADDPEHGRRYYVPMATVRELFS